MVDTSRRDALERSICAQLLPCTVDELRIVDRLLARLSVRRTDCGPLDPHEILVGGSDALADALFFICAREVAASDARLERLRCEAADEIHSAEAQRLLVEAGLAELQTAPVYAVR